MVCCDVLTPYYMCLGKQVSCRYVYNILYNINIFVIFFQLSSDDQTIVNYYYYYIPPHNSGEYHN